MRTVWGATRKAFICIALTNFTTSVSSLSSKLTIKLKKLGDLQLGATVNVMHLIDVP